MPKALEELVPAKQESRLRLYAYAIHDEHHEGWLKVGQTTRDVKKRVAEQLKIAAIKNFTIGVDESAERENGSTFTDHDLRNRLKQKGFANPELEWMVCSADDVKTAITELREGIELGGTHHLTFSMRAEQKAAVSKTYDYFHSIWQEGIHKVPRFLWNAKMRFGKTFSAYQLAKTLGATRILVVTFKPAVEDAWRSDLESHADFDGWQYMSKNTADKDPRKADKTRPLVYFGSFQDLLGKDMNGNIKPKNEWVHTTNWDLVVFDEYHFGAWREGAKELFEGEEKGEAKKEEDIEYAKILDEFDEELDKLRRDEKGFLPITTRAFLYLSGTPFRALKSGEFIEEQIFNWTYTDEQRAKQEFSKKYPDKKNPYAALPQMHLLTYQMPDELIAIARQGEFEEFDLNTFFKATGHQDNAEFVHKSEVQKWLNIIRGEYQPTQVDKLKQGAKKPPFPFSDVTLLPYVNHSFWLLPDVASVWAMKNLLEEQHNVFWHDYNVLPVAGSSAGIGLNALPPVRAAIGSGHDTKTITLSCAKLTTGVTVPQWSSMLMLRNLNSAETYFQAAFRVQSPWSINNPNGDDPNEEDIIKPVCFVFDFAPTRALRQLSEYGIGLSPHQPNPEKAVEELVGFLPVLAYDGSTMSQVDAGSVLDIAMAGTSATLLAKKWESALLVNVDNETLKRILGDPKALKAIMSIEGFRSLGDNVIQAVINKSEHVKAVKKEKGDAVSAKEKKELTEEEKQYKSARKQIQEKLIKFATRIPAFMYLTDFRENKLPDIIRKLEPELFRTVTGLNVEDFDLLVSLGVFNPVHMDQAIFAFRRYEDSSLSYAGIDSHEDLRKYGGFDTVVAKEA